MVHEGGWEWCLLSVAGASINRCLLGTESRAFLGQERVNSPPSLQLCREGKCHRNGLLQKQIVSGDFTGPVIKLLRMASEMHKNNRFQNGPRVVQNEK